MDLASLRRWWPLVAVAALLGLAALAAAHSSLQISRVTPPTDAVPTLPPYEDAADSLPRASSPPRELAQTESTELPGWIATLAVAVCVTVVVVVIGLLVWTLIRDMVRRRVKTMPPDEQGQSPTPTAEQVVAALDAGLLDLSDVDGDPRRAVIACWVRLEQAAAAAGTPRQIGDTSTDLVTRLLRGHDIAADVLAAFAEVYREARYATHAVDERVRVQARSALQRLRADLITEVAAFGERSEVAS